MIIRKIAKKKYKKFVDSEFKAFFFDFFGKKHGTDIYDTFSFKRKTITLAAIEKEKILGAMSVRLDRYTANIGAFVVSKDYKRKGIGLKLLKRCESLARKSKLKKVWLFTLPNIEAYGFYKKNGYQEEARLKRQWGRQDLCIMSKFL